MKFRKFIAASTRDCLRMMREALGADAMIVSTRRTTAGVEVVGIRAQDMPMADEVASETASASAPVAEAPREAPAGPPALWDDMEDESVRLSPAARVLALQDETAERPAPAVPVPVEAAPPRAEWPRLQEGQIPHLVRAGGDYADPAHAMAVAAAEDGTDKPVLRLGASRPVVDKRTPRANGPARPVERAARPAASAAPSVPPSSAPVAARLDEQDRAELASRVADPIVSEMRSMRDWLAHQMDAMAWRDSTQRHPLRRELWRRMVDCGFTPELARSVASRLPATRGVDEVDRWLAEVLVRNLACVPAEASIVAEGGRYAIVGPTGVGKTTTTAKLAAHCVVRYGTAALGLISTDQHRIGAVDQLHTFGRMLGVEVYAAKGASDLDVLLASMADRKLVLIDTAGVSQRDTHMARHLQSISGEGVKRLLVMPGGSHAEQAEDIVSGYSAGGLAGMVVSKLDEAVRLGGVLDAAIRHRVPLHYMTNGQRVPEDIHVANARLLVHRALRVRNAPVFALQAEELDWACEASMAPYAESAAPQPAQA
ncbi:flagellar biosynthesis protein FlhF [Pigmentiphaga sp.]|uniref:flagellar biosynthesis protein FlhF n=1 Tax=Pigmentiphaga sp. TaxID=1977564 RepID=UPI0025F397A1|nr:flagellar biosynthesis protein FlhF [Pigmentiphaga sp.]